MYRSQSDTCTSTSVFCPDTRARHPAPLQQGDQLIVQYACCGLGHQMHVRDFQVLLLGADSIPPQMPSPPHLPPSPPSPCFPPPPPPLHPGWTLVAQDIFPGATGWTSNAPLNVTTCGSHSMLGGFALFGYDAYVEKTFDLSAAPAHSLVRLELLFHKIDSCTTWAGSNARTSQTSRLCLHLCLTRCPSLSLCRRG